VSVDSYESTKLQGQSNRRRAAVRTIRTPVQGQLVYRNPAITWFLLWLLRVDRRDSARQGQKNMTEQGTRRRCRRTERAITCRLRQTVSNKKSSAFRSEQGRQELSLRGSGGAKRTKKELFRKRKMTPAAFIKKQQATSNTTT
jgi:hypothetical protein